MTTINLSKTSFGVAQGGLFPGIRYYAEIEGKWVGDLYIDPLTNKLTSESKKFLSDRGISEFELKFL